jgi:hypothetical protein
MVDASSNCFSPAFSTQNPVVCAGVVDLSFLGNTHVASHTASNGSTGYFFSGANQRATVVGSYAENDNPINVLNNNTMASLGGITPWTGNGFRLIGSLANALRIQNPADPSNLVQLDLGGAVPSPGHLMSFAAYRDSFGNSPFRMTFRSARGLQSTDWFATDIGFLSSSRSWMVAQDPSTFASRGQVWFPQNVLVGSTPTALNATSDAVIPVVRSAAVSASGTGNIFRVSPRVGDFGGVLEMTFTNSNGSPMDLSAANTVTFTFTPPLGRSPFTRTGSAVSGTTGLVRYFIGTGDLIVSGRWQVRATVTMNNSNFTSNTLVFYVNP